MNALHHIRHLDCTVVFARDMAAMRDFYGRVMGFEVNRELQRGWIEYRVGSCLLVRHFGTGGRCLARLPFD